MPNRIIRDELLRSHRYVHLPSDTHRLLFTHLILAADDFGNAEATTTALTIVMARPVSEECAAAWLGALSDVDLLRVYIADCKRYVHIPRFRQRMRALKPRHPRPPTKMECPEISLLAGNVRHVSDRGQSYDGHLSAEVKRSEVKGREEKGREEPPPPPRRLTPPPGVQQATWDAWVKRRGKSLTAYAIQLQTKHLAEWQAQGMDPNRVVERSLANDWKGLFPLDRRNGTSDINARRAATAAAIHAHEEAHDQPADPTDITGEATRLD